MSAKENTRLLALETLVEIEKTDIFARDALHKLLYQKQFMNKQDRAFITRLVEGVTEYRVRLDYVINSFSSTKVNKCKPFIRCLLRMGVYQMLYMDSVPNEAACNECVKLAKQKGFSALSGFVNGVLRNVERNLNNIEYPSEEASIISYLSVNYSMPEWLVGQMIAWYGEERTKTVLGASVETKDLTIRVNTKHIQPWTMMQRLTDDNVKVRQGVYVPEALHLQQINYVRRLPGFAEGDFFVQDESSMLLYHIANPFARLQSVKAPLFVLDLCAAPGGKCTHFAEQLGDNGIIEARDVSEQKAALLEENRERLQLNNLRVKVWDALIFDESLKGVADIVIADLPCSGLGIISRKNDIKYHVSREQLVELSNLQRTILTNAVSYLKPGGILLYSTCTINPSENSENAGWLLSHFPLSKESITADVPETLREYVIEDYMLQLLPGEVACDGFFISKFRKNEDM